ncbi:hypothetical protein RCC89_20625 [Cytophagaceae bacterium ABcell3]|nr:hypothetical protein RCC89_20625 [Cytophagaceae bacterium ABcell3]
MNSQYTALELHETMSQKYVRVAQGDRKEIRALTKRVYQYISRGEKMAVKQKP